MRQCSTWAPCGRSPILQHRGKRRAVSTTAALVLAPERSGPRGWRWRPRLLSHRLKGYYDSEDVYEARSFFRNKVGRSVTLVSGRGNQHPSAQTRAFLARRP